jgi:hypothetical protein
MKHDSRGFLVLEILIAGLILTSSIAASMYLFRMGFLYLEKANDSNVITSKLPQAVNLLKTIDLGQTGGTESIGDDVTLLWESKSVEKTRPLQKLPEGSSLSPFEHYLYTLHLKLVYKTLEREYEIRLFRYKRVVSVQE